MTADTLDAARAMGYPWDAFSEAAFARLEAERAAELALEAGDEPDRAAALFELETALLAEQRCRGDLADVCLLLLHMAVKERPGALSEVCRALARASDVEGARRLAALERRVEQLERDNRELARELVTLEDRIARGEYCATQ